MNYYVQYPDASSLHVTVYVKFICTSPSIDKIADTKLKLKETLPCKSAHKISRKSYNRSSSPIFNTHCIKEGGGGLIFLFIENMYLEWSELKRREVKIRFEIKHKKAHRSSSQSINPFAQI